VGNVLVGLMLTMEFLRAQSWDIGGGHHFFADDCLIYNSFHPDDIDVVVRTVNEYLMAIQR
jgi:hypothetical protein